MRLLRVEKEHRSITTPVRSYIKGFSDELRGFTKSRGKCHYNRPLVWEWVRGFISRMRTHSSIRYFSTLPACSTKKCAGEHILHPNPRSARIGSCWYSWIHRSSWSTERWVACGRFFIGAGVLHVVMDSIQSIIGITWYQILFERWTPECIDRGERNGSTSDAMRAKDDGNAERCVIIWWHSVS